MLLSSCFASTENIFSQDVSLDTQTSEQNETESATEPKTFDTEPSSDEEPESDPDTTPKPNPDPEPEPDPDEPAIEICDHLFGDWVEIVAPKCLGVAGLRERECSKCKETEQEEIYVEGHINIIDDVQEEATCTKKGLTAGSHCDACGKCREVRPGPAASAAGARREG